MQIVELISTNKEDFMEKTKKILSLMLAFVFLFGVMSVAVYAKSYTTNYKVMSNRLGYTSKGFEGQNCIQKYVEVKKGDTLKIYPSTSLTSSKLKSYVRYSVWVYDINTNERIVNKTCKSGSYISYKNNSKNTLYLSVQVRPYIVDTSFSLYARDTINAFLRGTSFKFKCTGISKY